MSEFDDCLKRRGLVPFSTVQADALAAEIRTAREDLDDAGLLLSNSRWRRATITAYYAMFHAARALLLDHGYAEKSHYCLLVGFREFFGATPEGRRLALAIEQARILRENADYRADFSEESARDTTALALEFVEFAVRHLDVAAPE